MGNQYKKNRINRKQKNENSLSNFYLLPVLFIIAIIPLIVFAKVIESNEFNSEIWDEGMIHFDFFHYYKSLYFIIASYIGGLLILILLWLNKIRFVKSKYYIPLGLYAFFVLLSSIFSDNPKVAFQGYLELFQGSLAIFGFIVLIITIINLVKEEKHIKAILCAFIFVSTIIGIIGIGQYFGYDIFKTNFGILLILPKELHVLAGEVTFSFAKYAVYSTLYNTNFVGSFAALMIPISFAIYFYQKRIQYVIASGLFVGLMVFVGVGSNSRAGIIGIAAALLLIGILFRKEFRYKPFHILIPFVLLVLVGFGTNIVSGGRVLNEIKNLSLTKDITNAEIKSDNTVYIEEMNFDDYEIEVLTEEEDIRIEFVNNELKFTDLDGVILESKKEGNKITLIDELYSEFVFTRSNDNPYYNFRIYSHSFNVWLTIDGFRFEGLEGKLFIPSNPDKIEFLDGYGSLFSSRAYIWSRSIPLLKNHILIGAGPDMFGLAFPQDDYIGKLNHYGVNIFTDKPHNMYLQTAINTGLISLIALLTMFGMYVFDSFRLFINGSFNSLQEYIGAGLFAGVIAYLIAGIFNDHIMSVAPLFYSILALGIAINHMISKKN